MIGLALVTCVAVLTDSVRVSTNDAIEGAFRADFIVFTEGRTSTRSGEGGAAGPEPARTHRGARDVVLIAAAPD